MRLTLRRFASIGIVVLALALIGFVAACGDGDNGTASPTDTTAAPSGLQEAIDRIDAMIVAAEGGDLEASKAAFEDGHDALHEVIQNLETSDPDQGVALDEAVEDAEADFEDDADAEHIIEIGQIIRDLLRQVE